MEQLVSEQRQSTKAKPAHCDGVQATLALRG